MVKIYTELLPFQQQMPKAASSATCEAGQDISVTVPTVRIAEFWHALQVLPNGNASADSQTQSQVLFIFSATSHLLLVLSK